MKRSSFNVCDASQAKRGSCLQGRVLICDRDPKWSTSVEDWLNTAGVRLVRTAASAPNCNAFAERFVRSVKEECLDRIVPLGVSAHLKPRKSGLLSTNSSL
jgi:hypothetical protein